VFRLSAQADPAFLAEMLYEAVNWHDDGAEERPSLESVLAVPENARYVSDWGRTGDLALCALDRRDEPVGAAWLRFFTAARPGYGYVADDVPELSIGVYPEFRRQKVGTLLLGSVIARAERDRTRGISLSVNRNNPAKRLYARNGFEVVADPGGDSLTMLLDLQ
jgi:ribosomal protein S18 acetylase RimI-like enzyme